jgi:predicted unusual protein kinase regulating ubiquinone biosynthesis (AarF/ABC1/UbiB family)
VTSEARPSTGEQRLAPAQAAGPSASGRARAAKGSNGADGGAAIAGARSEAARLRAARAPAPARRTTHHSYRFVRAYTTTFLVIGSYLWFYFLARFFGRSWADARTADVHLRNARRIEHTLLELGGLFIKVGQMLSSMANFLPAQFRSGLEAMQDQVPPRPYAEIAERIEAELGRPISELFTELHEAPLASASLGQVHEAHMKDGTHVVLKVQHRDIDEIVRLDLTTIRRIMGIVSIFVPVKGLDAYYHQIRAMISEELDFLREADNIRRIMANFRDQPDVVFPRPIEGLCTRRVMTATFVDGVKVGDVAALDALGIDRSALARKIVTVFCQMIFVDGVYHADPHPGNLLVGSNGELVLLDFGAVAQLSPQMREGIPEFLEGVIRRDTDRVIRAMRTMGFLARSEGVEVSEKVIEFFHERFHEEVKLESFNLKDIKLDPQKGIESLVDLRKMNVGLKDLSGAFHVPRDWVLLERTLLLLTGVCTQLDPEMSPMDVVRPYLTKFVLGNRDWAQIALEAAKDTALQALTLPADLRRFLTRANRGESEVRVRGLAQSAQLLYAGVRQLIYTAIGIACGLSALELSLAGHAHAARLCLFGAGAAGVVLVLSLFTTRR